MIIYHYAKLYLMRFFFRAKYHSARKKLTVIVTKLDDGLATTASCIKDMRDLLEEAETELTAGERVEICNSIARMIIQRNEIVISRDEIAKHREKLEFNVRR
jgi:hypothetical protein